MALWRAISLSLVIRWCALVLLSIFAWFVWPTPYYHAPARLHHNPLYYGGTTTLPDERVVVQVNRFTGVICLVGQSCWREGPWRGLVNIPYYLDLEPCR